MLSMLYLILIVQSILYNEYISFPKLFYDIRRIYPPEIANISLSDEFEIDITPKPLIYGRQK